MASQICIEEINDPVPEEDYLLLDWLVDVLRARERKASSDMGESKVRLKHIKELGETLHENTMSKAMEEAQRAAGENHARAVEHMEEQRAFVEAEAQMFIQKELGRSRELDEAVFNHMLKDGKNSSVKKQLGKEKSAPINCHEETNE